jgi:hypothetical protein
VGGHFQPARACRPWIFIAGLYTDAARDDLVAKSAEGVGWKKEKQLRELRRRQVKRINKEKRKIGDEL